MDALRRARDQLIAPTPAGGAWIALLAQAQTPDCPCCCRGRSTGSPAPHRELPWAAALVEDEEKSLGKGLGKGPCCMRGRRRWPARSAPHLRRDLGSSGGLRRARDVTPVISTVCGWRPG
jgi:hypothetical protein